jgi:hypothetical protein
LEDAVDEEGADFRPPSAIAWIQQTWDMYFFDNLVYNIDRNAGNLLVSPDYRLWLIDHTRAFVLKNELMNDKVTKMRESTWERLLALSESEIRDAMKGYLTPLEISSLLKRRELLIAHIQQLVSERGKEVVFYN